jgi:hypothetical protein
MSDLAIRSGEATRAAKALLRGGPSPVVAVAACAGGGMLLVSLANALSRQALAPTQLIFWAGVLLIVLPIGYRLSLPGTSARERLGLVVLFGFSLYVVKVVRDPFLFTFPDEPIHSYNASQVGLHHHLFNSNPILPATASYPGLAGATSALMALTGMSSFGAGVFLIGAARLTFMIALFILFGRISGSARLAGIGVAIYAGNSNFLYWGAQYSYESLSLPLLVAVLAAFAEREAAGLKSARAWAVPVLLGTAAIVVTHHLTSYALVVVLVAIAVVYRLWRLPRPNPWPFAVFALVTALAWLLLVASSTVGYLSPVLSNAFDAIFHTVSGETAPRTLFHSSATTEIGGTPILARLVGLASVGLLFVGFLAGIREAWRRRRGRPFVLLFCIAAAAFFAALGLRFAPAAWETGNRAGEFLFIGLSFVVAYGALRLMKPGPKLRERRAAFVAGLGIVIVGGAIAGWPWDAQLARPLRITAGAADIDSEPLALSRWIANHLPEGKFAAGDADARLILAPGAAKAKTGDALDIKAILAEPSLEGWELPLLHDHHVGYLVADRRKLASDNVRGYFFSVPSDEHDALGPLEAMHKFARVPLGRVYDSGNIVLYSLGNYP